MSDKVGSAFTDTSVLAYFTTNDDRKGDRAEQILDQGGIISVQVLNELANVLRKKMRFSWAEIREALVAIRAAMEVVPLTTDIHDRGLYLAERHGFHIYDAMIVAAALETGCSVLWSEDMQHGMLIEDRLTIRNPFRIDGQAPSDPSR